MALYIEDPSSDNLNRKRKRRKLLVNDKVEVRSLDDGFQGSWHPGTVIACDYHLRQVKYDHLLSDTDNMNIVDNIIVTPIIDGLIAADETQCEYRGIIRPMPPSHAKLGKWELHYGLCVDAWYTEAWWEGVIFDHEDGSDERIVFFPDIGDEIQFSIDKLRITRDWNEATEDWEQRGSWLFLELMEEYEQEAPLFVSVKQLWYDLREKKCFDLVKEWTYSNKSLWEDLVLECVNDHLAPTVNQLSREIDLNEDFVLETPALLELSDPALNFSSERDTGLTGTHITPDGSNQVEKHELAIEENLDMDKAMHTLDGDDGNSSGSSSSLYNKTPMSSHWRPVGFHIVPGAKFCPDAVTEYAQAMLAKRKFDTTVATNFRRHLLYLGWEILSSKYRNTCRMCYISPSGKSYYSLVKVCQDLQQFSSAPSPLSQPDKQYSSVCPNELSSFLHIDKPQVREEKVQSKFPPPRGPGSADIVPQYCPQAAVNWIRHLNNKVNGGSKTQQKLSLKAKKHLLAVGWLFSYIKKIGTNYKERYELRYVSPEGKRYITLLAACQACINSSEISAYKATTCTQMKGVVIDEEAESHLKLSSEVTKTKFEGNLVGQISHSTLHGLKIENLPKTGQGKVSSALQKSGDEMSSRCSARVLRSSNREGRMGSSSTSSHIPRSVLSWLIDNNVVLPREKVHYHNQTNHLIIDGRITRDGIRCGCCNNVYTLRAFEIHAGSNLRRPAANIFLADGRSLLDCQMQMVKNNNKGAKAEANKTKSYKSQAKSDYICSACQYGGELLLCDQCPSAFHKTCLGLKDVPEGDWFCPSCCCAICRDRHNNESYEHNMDDNFHKCDQCEHQYHVGCLKRTGVLKLESDSQENWFCSKTCKKIYSGLHKLLGKQVAIGPDNLTWTLLKYTKCNTGDPVTQDTERSIESFSKLNVALGVMHECFESVVEARTRSDLVEDIIFSRWSNLNRLNFTGFYTVILEKNDELITVATVRVFGEKVAEVPLVATRFHYRRMGMCGVLIDELEKKLMELGVERLVLPSVASTLNTWTTSFGFSKMTSLDRSDLLGYTLLGFQGTVMCQKILRNNHSARASIGVQRDANIEFEQHSPVSEVFQAERIQQRVDIVVDQGYVETYVGNCSHGSGDPSLMAAMDNQQPTPLECLPTHHESSLKSSKVNDPDHMKNGEGNGNSEVVIYKRRRVLKFAQMT